MLPSTSTLRGCPTNWLRRLCLLLLGLTCVAVLNIAGCPKPQFDQLIPEVTLQQIKDIRNNAQLDAAQKLQALKDLGIDDPQLLEVLLNTPLPGAD